MKKEDIKRFFKTHEDIIESVWLSNKRHYSIILKEDNSENRARIFDFFDLPYSESVYFQFYSAELLNTKDKEEIKL